MMRDHDYNSESDARYGDHSPNAPNPIAARVEQEMDNEDDNLASRSLKHRLTGLRYPRHILDVDSQPYCGIELSDDHQRLLRSSDPSDLQSVDDHLEQYDAIAVRDFCQNCLRDYVANNEDDKMVQAVCDSSLDIKGVDCDE